MYSCGVLYIICTQLKAEKEVRGGRADLATTYLDKVGKICTERAKLSQSGQNLGELGENHCNPATTL